LELGAELLHASAALADDDARARGLDDDLGLVGRALDLDARDARVRVVVADVLTKLEVFVEPLRVVLVFVPLGVPGLDDPEAEPVRMRLLTHCFSSRPRRPG